MLLFIDSGLVPFLCSVFCALIGIMPSSFSIKKSVSSVQYILTCSVAISYWHIYCLLSVCSSSFAIHPNNPISNRYNWNVLKSSCIFKGAFTCLTRFTIYINPQSANYLTATSKPLPRFPSYVLLEICIGILFHTLLIFGRVKSCS